MAVFNEILKELRIEKGLNQIELANLLNCNRQKIADMERGKTSPNVEILMKLSKIFDTSTDYLLGLSNVKTVNTDLQAVCNYIGLSENAVNRIKYEWVSDSGSERLAMYEDEPNETKRIENEIVCKNFLFEVSHRMFDIFCLYSQANSNIKPCKENLDELLKYYGEIRQYELNINGKLYNLSTYLTDIVKDVCDKEISDFTKLKKTIEDYVNEHGGVSITKGGEDSGND